MWSVIVTSFNQTSHALLFFLEGSEYWVCYVMVVSFWFMDMTSNKVDIFSLKQLYISIIHASKHLNALGLQNHLASKKSLGREIMSHRITGVTLLFWGKHIFL